MAPPTIIVHDLAQAKAALAAAGRLATPVHLRSAVGAAGSLGPGVFMELTETAREAHPGVAAVSVLDCGDEAGLALAAIRRGCRHLAVTLPEPARAKIEALAEARSVCLHGPADAALDLAGHDDPEAAAAAFLAGGECDG